MTQRKAETLSEERLPAAANAAVLSIENLSVAFPAPSGFLPAVDGISLTLRRGKTMGLVGESGCGKSMTGLAIMGLVPPPGTVSAGRVLLDGRDLLAEPAEALREIRGNRISMIFQEPMTSLNPVFTVGSQITEALLLHRDMPRREASEQAIEMLEQVGIPDPHLRAKAYPHQLSGGMRQRAIIAMALICRPDVLIADEPTTALDTTIQAQILDLIADLQERLGMAVLFISHNLAVVSQVADEILVMYAGRIAEQAPADELFQAPRHPYTRGLISTLPGPGLRGKRLPTLPGTVGDAALITSGCRFRPRCPNAVSDCGANVPVLADTAPGHGVACYNPAGGSV